MKPIARSVLAVDAGNSRIKWAVHDGSRWKQRGWIATNQARRLQARFAKMTTVDAIVISNVAGAAVRAALAGPADVVLTDMAAPTTGHRATDHLRTTAAARLQALQSGTDPAPLPQPVLQPCSEV